MRNTLQNSVRLFRFDRILLFGLQNKSNSHAIMNHHITLSVASMFAPADRSSCTTTGYLFAAAILSDVDPLYKIHKEGDHISDRRTIANEKTTRSHPIRMSNTTLRNSYCPHDHAEDEFRSILLVIKS